MKFYKFLECKNEQVPVTYPETLYVSHVFSGYAILLNKAQEDCTLKNATIYKHLPHFQVFGKLICQ